MPRTRQLGNYKTGIWSEDEHDRFLAATRAFPRGPWRSIAKAVGTRSVRQVQTHTQKYYEKVMRRVRGLRKDRSTWARVEHRIDDDILELCALLKSEKKTQVEAKAETAASHAKKTNRTSLHNNPLRQCTEDLPPLEEALDSSSIDSQDKFIYT